MERPNCPPCHHAFTRRQLGDTMDLAQLLSGIALPSAPRSAATAANAILIAQLIHRAHPRPARTSRSTSPRPAARSRASDGGRYHALVLTTSRDGSALRARAAWTWMLQQQALEQRLAARIPSWRISAKRSSTTLGSGDPGNSELRRRTRRCSGAGAAPAGAERIRPMLDSRCSGSSALARRGRTTGWWRGRPEPWQLGHCRPGCVARGCCHPGCPRPAPHSLPVERNVDGSSLSP